MLMISDGLDSFVVLIATAVTSGKGKVMIRKADVSRMRLFMYIALRGLRFGYDCDSVRVQDPWIGADSVCFDQCCSCMISSVNLDELGSLRMLCVLDRFLWRLYCKIAIVLTLLFSVIRSSGLLRLVSSLLICFLLRRVCCIRCAMLGVSPHILCIWCCWCSLLCHGLHFHSSRISVCFCSALPGVRICSICNIV